MRAPLDRRRIAALIAAAALVGCTACPPPLSTTSAVGAPIALDAATPEASFDVQIHAPEQACGCTWCGDPTLSLSLSSEVGSANPPGAAAFPVVRLALAPSFTPAPQDTLEPPLPLDVVLTPEKPSSAATLEAKHLCPSDDPCDVTYRLTVTSVEPGALGAITVAWSAGVEFPSKPDGSLRVTLTP